MAGDHVSLKGEVVDVQKGKFFVEVEGGNVVTAQLSGKLRKNKIKVVLGDEVTVKVSPYDVNNGLIVFRK